MRANRLPGISRGGCIVFGRKLPKGIMNQGAYYYGEPRMYCASSAFFRSYRLEGKMGAMDLVSSFLGAGVAPLKSHSPSRQAPPTTPQTQPGPSRSPAAAHATLKSEDRAPAGFCPAAATQAVPEGTVPFKKGAGYRVPPDAAVGPVVKPPASMRVDPPAGGIPVRAHGRVPPQPKTLDTVLEQFRLYELRPLSLGKYVVDWLAHQPELPEAEQLPRGEALRRVRFGLVQQNQVTLAARLDRFVACYWIAMEFGWDDACRLRYAAIRELLPLFGRNAATEEYELRPEKAAATRALWGRMLAEKLTSDAVRAEVRKIRPPQVLRLRGRSGRLAATLREIKRYRAQEDLLAIIRQAQEQLERLGAAAGAAVG